MHEIILSELEAYKFCKSLIKLGPTVTNKSIKYVIKYYLKIKE
jgi:hypothetical protein